MIATTQQTTESFDNSKSRISMGRCSVDGVAINAHRPAKATHILVPVDDSHDSEEAVLWALTNVWKGTTTNVVDRMQLDLCRGFAV